MINREVKRAKLVKRHGGKRVELKKIISNPNASYDEKLAAAS
jgi:small subunit ribosomal protein S14